jgi:hypothetical protein
VAARLRRPAPGRAALHRARGRPRPARAAPGVGQRHLWTGARAAAARRGGEFAGARARPTLRA